MPGRGGGGKGECWCRGLALGGGGCRAVARSEHTILEQRAVGDGIIVRRRYFPVAHARHHQIDLPVLELVVLQHAPEQVDGDVAKAPCATTKGEGRGVDTAAPPKGPRGCA